MADLPKPQPGEQELAEDRATLAALMERCLKRVRKVKIPPDTPPLLVPKRDD
jgi:hypothetical protein